MNFVIFLKKPFELVQKSVNINLQSNYKCSVSVISSSTNSSEQDLLSRWFFFF